MHRKTLILAIVSGLGLAGALAYAANRGAIVPVPGFAAGNAAFPVPVAAAPSTAATFGGNLRPAAKPAPPPPPPTDAQVGDAASFGRNVRWLGLASAFVFADPDCASLQAENPDVLCQPITDTTASTSFNFTDIARVTLPANATNSLLCHWFSPRVVVGFVNEGATPVLGRLSYNPTLTVENAVLADPALIDPTTGVAFNGRLTTSMSASETFTIALDPGLPITQSLRDSVVCQAGFVSRRQLIETYGLTAAQVSSFFANPTTIRMNVSGNMRHASFAQLSLGLRIVGD